MDPHKAQQIIKAALDQAAKAGIFQSLEAAAITATAWQTITQLLNKNESANT
jgi:hypothetical protein